MPEGIKDHLTVDQVKGYIFEKLSIDETLKVIEHMEDCEECMNKVAAIQRAVGFWNGMTHETLRAIFHTRALAVSLEKALASPEGISERILDKLKNLYKRIKEKAWISVDLTLKGLRSSFERRSINAFNNTNTVYSMDTLSFVSAQRGTHKEKEPGENAIAGLHIEKDKEPWGKVSILEGAVELTVENLEEGDLVVLKPSSMEKPFVSEVQLINGVRKVRFDNLPADEYTLYIEME